MRTFNSINTSLWVFSFYSAYKWIYLKNLFSTTSYFFQDIFSNALYLFQDHNSHEPTYFDNYMHSKNGYNGGEVSGGLQQQGDPLASLQRQSSMAANNNHHQNNNEGYDDHVANDIGELLVTLQKF